ncbi:GIY-YIG nuclease family protein [Candidatus Parcubacteria bacterium]|nr:MAG: GIY-YIG nuclease family protein [Candidatus Parcubacteria bacterium]
MFYVYILLSKRNNKFYIGFTKDLKRRRKEHSNGLVESTKNRRPLLLIYYEAYLKTEDAQAREKFFKTTKGKMQLRKQLNNSLSENTPDLFCPKLC